MKTRPPQKDCWCCHGDGTYIDTQENALLVCGCTTDAEDACECDNTHKQNDTVCQWCWANGRRKWADPAAAARADAADVAEGAQP